MSELTNEQKKKLITLENLKDFKDKLDIEIEDAKSVNFTLEVDDDGNLVAIYPDGESAPEGLSIDEDGYLVYVH